jgi:pimeloyl-ACP methyl ester carboxylesterase
MLVDWQPPAVRDLPAVRVWARRHADDLAGTAIATALRELPDRIPLPDGVAALRQVTAPALVIAQEGDPIHPVAVAERLAGLLPRAELEVLTAGGASWRDRDRLRERVVSFLN